MPGEHLCGGGHTAARGLLDCARGRTSGLSTLLVQSATSITHICPPQIASTIFRAIILALLAAGLYWHLRVNVHPQLVYYADGITTASGRAVGIPVFVRGAEFRAGFFRRPGGPVEYCAAAIAQLCYYPCAGPAMLTACAVLLYGASVFLFRGIGFTNGWLWALAPWSALVWNYNRYVLPIDSALAIASNLLFGCAYLLLAGSSSRAVAALLLPSAILVSYLLTGPAAMLLAGTCVLWELFARRSYLVAGAGLATAIFLPALCGWWLQLVPTWNYREQKAICPWLPAANAPQLALYGVLLGMVLVRCCVAAAARWYPWTTEHAGRRLAGLSRAGCHAAAVCLMLTASVAIALGTLDRQLRWTLQLNYLARTEQWAELLERLEGYPAELYTASLSCDVCRALYETGRLGSDLFRYPQQPDALFQRGQKGAFVRGSGDVLFLLGCVNEAEHVAHEYLEVHGERPEILRLLARIHLSKGNATAARVFLNVLRNDLIHGDWADAYLQRLAANPADAEDPLVRAARANMPLHDRLAEQTTDEDVLAALLESNPANRMAAEYLVAHCLLTRQPDKLAQYFQRFQQLRSCTQPEALPPLWAEALVWSSYRPARGQPVGPAEMVHPRIVQQVHEAAQLARQYSHDREALDAELAQRFPYSFSRYLLTGRSGAQQ